MPNDPVAPELNELAEELEAEFSEYSKPEEFSDLIPVVETSDVEHPTLIVHLEMDNAKSVADDVEAFLRKRGARTERETYPEEIRVLATVS